MCIYVQNVQKAMLMIGLNPSDQECVDIPNEWARKGLLYFPDFCDVALTGFRPSEEEEEDFYQHTFKVLLIIQCYIFTFVFVRLFVELIHSQLTLGPKNTSLATIKYQRYSNIVWTFVYSQPENIE